MNDLFFGPMAVNFVELGQFTEFNYLTEHCFSLTQWLGVQESVSELDDSEGVFRTSK